MKTNRISDTYILSKVKRDRIIQDFREGIDIRGIATLNNVSYGVVVCILEQIPEEKESYKF